MKNQHPRVFLRQCLYSHYVEHPPQLDLHWDPFLIFFWRSGTGLGHGKIQKSKVSLQNVLPNTQTDYLGFGSVTSNKDGGRLEKIGRKGVPNPRPIEGFGKTSHTF
jgi:hypothetical protein